MPVPYMFGFSKIFPFCAKFHGLAFDRLRHISPVEKKEGEEHETEIPSVADGGGGDFL